MREINEWKSACLLFDEYCLTLRLKNHSISIFSIKVIDLVAYGEGIVTTMTYQTPLIIFITIIIIIIPTISFISKD